MLSSWVLNIIPFQSNVLRTKNNLFMPFKICSFYHHLLFCRNNLCFNRTDLWFRSNELSIETNFQSLNHLLTRCCCLERTAILMSSRIRRIARTLDLPSQSRVQTAKNDQKIDRRLCWIRHFSHLLSRSHMNGSIPFYKSYSYTFMLLWHKEINCKTWFAENIVQV